VPWPGVRHVLTERNGEVDDSMRGEYPASSRPTSESACAVTGVLQSPSGDPRRIACQPPTRQFRRNTRRTHGPASGQNTCASRMKNAYPSSIGKTAPLSDEPVRCPWCRCRAAENVFSPPRPG
jgi:hypothetical protein